MNSYKLFLKQAVYGIIPAMVMLASCKKDKLELKNDYRPITDVRGNSLSRLVNMSGYNQVQVNGDTLTNYTILQPNESIKYPATYYFPENGRLGKTWNIPQALFNEKGEMRLLTEATQWGATLVEATTIDMKQSADTAFDYYLLMPAALIETQSKWVKIPRDITAPSRPDHFKVRILNLSAEIKSRTMESLEGAMGLGWADGTPINAAASGIAQGHYSDYVEVPYGTYQLKVLNDRGIQVPALGGNNSENTGQMDPTTSTITMSITNTTHVSTGLTYAPVQTYQPGGVYTIVIHPGRVKYMSGSDEVDAYQNCFSIIQDIAAPANRTYGKIQLVNALGAGDLQLFVDGKASGGTVAYTKGGEAQVFVTGRHVMEVKAGNGNTVATATADLRAGDNFSIWAISGSDGKASAMVVSNNLSGTWNDEAATDDGSLSGRSATFPIDIRFLNCSDEPYLTFTGADGALFSRASASQNLLPGIAPVDQPNLRFGIVTQRPISFMAFRSQPGVVPGTWLSDVPVENSTTMVARPELYSGIGRMVPVLEPGVFTVALVGSTASGASPEKKAKIMIIKHTK